MTARKLRKRLFGAPGSAAAGLVCWAALGAPAHLAGLGCAVILGMALWPLPVLLTAPWPDDLAVRRADRAAYRKATAAEPGYSRPPVPARLQRAIRAADRNRCIVCRARGSGVVLHIDHRVPWAAGGLSSFWNLVMLCEHCNLTKGYYYEHENGYIGFRARSGNRAAAAAIASAERRRVRYPLRWIRMAWELAA